MTEHETRNTQIISRAIDDIDHLLYWVGLDKGIQYELKAIKARLEGKECFTDLRTLNLSYDIDIKSKEV